MKDRSEWAKKYADQACNWIGDAGDATRKYFEGQFAAAILGVDPFDGSREAVGHAAHNRLLMIEAQEEARAWLASLPQDVRKTVPGGVYWWAHDVSNRIGPSRPATPEEVAWLRETGALDE